MSDVKITPSENGPYIVQGTVTLRDQHGNEIPVPGERFALCRCGGSTNKPFCDGTHSKIGFQGAMAAVQKAEE